MIRDRFGIKPLYYYFENNKFYFSSEIDPLRKNLNFTKKDLNIDQVNNYFTLGYIHGENRIYKKIKSLKSGSVLEFNIKKKNIRTFKWFDIKNVKDIFFDDKKKLIEKLYEKVDNAVNLWTRSDVDKVFSLSGGLDSSLLAATYAKQGKKINTISFVYNHKKYDRWNESINSDLIAKKINSNHQKYYWSSNDFKKDLPEVINSLEEPFGNSILPWFIYKKIKQKFKVCISGNGGDELFGNYSRVENYKSFKGSFYNKKNFEKNYFYRNFYFNNTYREQYLNFKTRNISEIFYKMLLENKSKIDRDRNLSLLDYMGQFKDDMLFSEDKLSMRNSVEVRAPFLDNELFDFVFSLKKQRTTDNNYKYLIKELLKKLIPSGVLKSNKKGFHMPLSLFLRENYKRELLYYLSKKNLKKVGYINETFYDECVIPMLNGNNNDIQIIWNILVFHIWEKLD